MNTPFKIRITQITTMYNVEILADSLSPQGNRLTTMKITFPRFILAELNTHRMFSRNSASSRAIPFKKMVQMVEENPFIPIAWQKDHKGMQGTEYLINTEANIEDWLKARDYAIEYAENLHNGGHGVTKQLCNRLLEPFMWHTVIVTATEWENFFKLRCPQYVHEPSGIRTKRSKKDWVDFNNQLTNEQKSEPKTDLDWLKINTSQAEIHIQAIAELMWDAYNESTPKELKPGEWNIPFGDGIDTRDLLPFMAKDYDVENPQLHTIAQKWKVKIATARCARISYETLGDEPKIDYEADIKLHDRLLTEGHMSPFEHCARVMSDEEYLTHINGQLHLNEEGRIEETSPNLFGWCRNFRGFIQYRHLVENKNL